MSAAEGAQGGRLPRARLVVLGRDGCGKTALCVRFLTRRFIGEYDRQREVTYRCRKEVDGEPIELEILDTANKQVSGLPGHAPLERSIRWGDGFVLIYSVTDRGSFQAVSRLKRLIDHVKQALGIPAIIVANKCDMEGGRVVRPEEGQALASDLRCGFFELSVADGGGYEAVEAALAALVREVRRGALHSRVLHVRRALISRLARSKTMQW
ncbi:ras-related and estrogen-regulated growth inhibitor-like [Petromyzon marinus]|uniref:ras-related and estrogen-regulated growth inhibitor-like n=1 Tax=Petromyzon marinus TaxID=7757 RepID=UPI003F6E6CE8